MTNMASLPPSKKERLFTKDFSLIMLGGMGTSFMNHLFAPALALHIEAIGGLAVHVGFVAMAYSIASLLTRPISGVLSDKFGRTPQLVLGAFLCAVACILYGITIFIPALVAIRGLMGIGFGMHSTNAGAVAADVSPKSRLAEGIGIFGLGATLAQAVGPGLAVFIIGAGAISNFRNLFFLAAAMCAFSTIANSCISYERKRKKTAKLAAQTASESPAPQEINSAAENESAQELPKTFLGFEYAVFPIVAALILIFSGAAGLFFYLPALARDAEFGNPALFFVLSATGVFISRMIIGRVVDRRGADFVLIPGAIVMILGYMLIPFVNSLTVLVLMGLPIGFANGAINPTFNSLVFKRCTAARRGTASGAFFSAIDIGFGLGPVVLGLLADAFDLRFVFWGGAALMTAGFTLYLFIASEKPFIKYFSKFSKIGLE
ncbi:MAG: MFS transporter [Oscillospiraceae bacterium]|nr:MFS transporter [Oscillospiraceae bacterium]